MSTKARTSSTARQFKRDILSCKKWCNSLLMCNKSLRWCISISLAWSPHILGIHCSNACLWSSLWCLYSTRTDQMFWSQSYTANYSVGAGARLWQLQSTRGIILMSPCSFRGSWWYMPRACLIWICVPDSEQLVAFQSVMVLEICFVSTGDGMESQ